MDIFNSYVKLPEGIRIYISIYKYHPIIPHEHFFLVKLPFQDLLKMQFANKEQFEQVIK